MPPLLRLAAAAGVSPSSMAVALAGLKAQGVLRARRGGFITIAAAPETSLAAQEAVAGTDQPRLLRWERLAARISQETLDGVYGPGATLGTAKTLGQRYGVCHRTLRRALEALVRDGTLESSRRSYRVPQVRTQASHGTVALVARGNPDGRVALFGPRTQEMLLAMERECAQARVRLEFLPYDYLHGRLVPGPKLDAALGRRQGAGPVLGFVVWTVGIQDPGPDKPDNVANLLPHLMRPGRPIALLSESGERETILRPSPGSRIRLFSVAHSPGAGERVGQYLRGLGHRRVAFISPFHDSVWSRNRLEGLERAMAGPAPGQGVRAFVSVEPVDDDYREELGAAVDRDIRDALVAWRTGANDRQRTLSRVVESLNAEIHTRFERQLLEPRIAPLIAGALSDRSITAWVAVNDLTAFVCLAELAARGMRVPQDLSVVGFDDTFEAFSAGLTSYNFNLLSAVRATLVHVLDPAPAQRVRQEPVVEIDGFVTERRTVARCA